MASAPASTSRSVAVKARVVTEEREVAEHLALGLLGEPRDDVVVDTLAGEHARRFDRGAHARIALGGRGRDRRDTQSGAVTDPGRGR